jgi:predicted phosphoadenosine phosphosulfate sulfurtransferase
MGTKTKIKKYIKDWEERCYPNGIPDEAPIELEKSNLVPSYRRICFAIMKNDFSLKYLGFSSSKCQVYNELKKIELIQRGVIKQDNQLKLL